MRTSEQINEIATALAKAQGAIEGAVKGNINPHFKSKYADLGAVWEACREHLSKNGIAVIQPVDPQCVTTRLIHSSGQWVEDGGIPLKLSKDDMQGLGSAMTYARRYGLMAMVGIAPEDDDGNAASQPSAARPVAVTAPSAPMGFDQWWLDMQAVADNGLSALEKAWKASPPVHRQHLNKTNIAGWETLKAKAAQNESVPA